MMDNDLGAFRDGFAMWRTALDVAPIAQRIEIFINAANEVAMFISEGLDRTIASDELTEIAIEFQLDIDRTQEIITHAFKQIKANGGGPFAGAKQPDKMLSLTSLIPNDDTEILPRDWVVPGFLMRRQITVLVAPSGSGKSLLTLQLGMACAQGISWAGWKPRRQCKVLVINSEDDCDEMRRRVKAALCIMSAIKRDEIRDSFVATDQTTDAIIAKFDARTKTLVRTPLLEQIVATIIANKFDIVFVDPFAETFEGDENSNSELKWAGILWRDVARRTGAAICLIHHTKKYASGMAGDVDAARGASALIGIARIVATLFPMTPQEAKDMLANEIDKNRAAYLRYDDAKANLNMISTIAKWFHKRTITLNNGTAEAPPDDVGVLVPWKEKDIFDTVDKDKLIQFLVQLDIGMVDDEGNPTGEFWTLQTRKNKESDVSRYVGDFAAKFFEIAFDRAVALVNALADRKDIVTDKYHSKRTRKEATRVRSRNAQQQQTAPEPAGDMEPELL